MKRQLLVADTNVFLDLLNINAFDLFFDLDFTICTTDLVVYEIKNILQKEKMLHYIEQRRLEIICLASEELHQAAQIQTVRTLRRITDKSVLWVALQRKIMMLTGDEYLRLEAESRGLKVQNSIWVFDELLNTDRISAEIYCKCLNKLIDCNEKLPKQEIEERLTNFNDDN